MRRPTRWIILLLIGSLLAILLRGMRPEAAAEAGPCVGWVQSVRGAAYWRASPTAAREVLLPEADQYRGLRSGEQVLCRGGSLQLMLNGRLREVKPAEGWVTIPPPLRTNGVTERAIDGYGRRLGAERPLGSAIYSPADGSRIRPARLVVRWNPDPSWKRVTLALRDETGQELWRRPRVEASTGKLDDAELRSRLLRLNSTSSGTLELQLITPDGTTQAVRFALLPAAEEAQLAADLAVFAKSPGLMPYIGRAQCLIQRRLYNEAAEEYEAALAQAPESRALLEKTLQLQRLVGNTPRVEVLEQRLAGRGK